MCVRPSLSVRVSARLHITCELSLSLYVRVYAGATHNMRTNSDGTKYSKYHPENYLSHHLAAISMAAVYADACHIDDGVTGLKQDALRASASPDEE